jgi:uncharacterized protein (DUF2267 family)
MKTEAFYRTVMAQTGPIERDVVERATSAVLHALRDRLTPEEATHRKTFYERVRGEAGLESRHDAELLTTSVFTALKYTLSPGEGEHVMAQLPADLKALWVGA